MLTSDLRPEVEIWLFRACAMANMQYNRYYSYSSVIVDLAMGQIPRSTERISSFFSLSICCPSSLSGTSSKDWIGSQAEVKNSLIHLTDLFPGFYGQSKRPKFTRLLQFVVNLKEPP